MVHDIGAPISSPGMVLSHPMSASVHSMGGRAYLTRYHAGSPLPSSICVHSIVSVLSVDAATLRSSTRIRAAILASECGTITPTGESSPHEASGRRERTRLVNTILGAAERSPFVPGCSCKVTPALRLLLMGGSSLRR